MPDTARTLRNLRDPALWFAVLAIGLGVFLRCDLGLLTRSLWLDEAFIANVVVEYDWLELFNQPLEYGHFVPPGFLIVTKLFGLPFGFQDWSLRLLPMCCGVASLPLLFYAGSQYTSRWSAALATSLLASSKLHIYYSAELKQYSTDVFVALCILAVMPRLGEKIRTARGRGILAAAGLLAPWFSHPSVFVLAAGGMYWAIRFASQRQWHSTAWLSAVGLSWIASFAAQYFFVMGGGLSTASPIAPYLFEFWGQQDAFMPSFTLEGMQWMHAAIATLLTGAGHLGNATFALVLFWLGSFSLLLWNRRALVLLLSPVLFAMVASHFHAYIFSKRLLLFLVPAFYLVIAEGIARLRIGPDGGYARLWNYPIGLCLIGLIFNPLQPFIALPKEDIKPAMRLLSQHRDEDETVYVFFWSEPAFRFYARSFGLEPDECQIAQPPPPKRFPKEIDYYRMSRGKVPTVPSDGACIYGTSETVAAVEGELAHIPELQRVWLLFSHTPEPPVGRLSALLKRKGVMKISRRFFGSYLLLYEFGGQT